MPVGPPRVRFAPSPTGYFHVGGAKTALYNWIFARQHGGVFILRIEDTDTERNRPEWVEGIQSALRWVGIDWDEGPYFQSERAGRHAEAIQRLLSIGRAYYCDCVRDRVDERNRAAGAARTGYDGYCRERGLGPGAGRAVRFRAPDDGTTVVTDLIRGTPTFDNALIEDFVIQRANGTAMFLLANVVDDMDMRVSHVIRAEEHLPNTPKAILLWEALEGGPLPVFAHVPLLVNEKRQKLSKRRDPVALEMYRDEGYLPEAMRNFLMVLGWAPRGDKEIVPWEQIMREFDLADVNSAPAYFDVAKLRAFNGEYIRALPVDEFVDRCRPWLDPTWDVEVVTRLAPLVQERVTTLGEVPGYVDFLFLDTPPYDEASWVKAMRGDAAVHLSAFIDAFEKVTWTALDLKQACEDVSASFGLKLNKTQAPLRVALTGRTVGPPLMEAMEVLGRDRVLSRLRAARAKL